MESGKKSGRPAKTGISPFTAIFCDLIKDDTQKAAAEKIGVSRQNVSKWVSGTTTPDVDTLCRIADAYGVTTDYLLGRTKAKTSNVEMRAMCDYLMLDEKTTEAIRCFALEYENAQGEFGTVIRSKWFDSFMKNIKELSIAEREKFDIIEFRIVRSIYSFFAECEKGIVKYK